MIANGADKVASYFTIGREAYYEGYYVVKVRYDSLYKLQKAGSYSFSDSTSVRDSMRLWYQRADSAFTKVTQLSPDYAGGFLWKARMELYLDPERESSTWKESYEKALAILEKGDLEKNRKSMIECYKYLGSYAFLNYERLLKTDKQQAEAMKNTTMEYFQKVLQLDPTDVQSTEVITELKKPEYKKPEPKKTR